MSLKIGIVGLPNVGKSTLFSAITNLNAEIANYPFATIEPNFGVVEVKDPRFDFLVEKFQPKKSIRNTIEFVDIAGLISGASEGEGLGNAFLSHIREADAICMMLRCFENKDIVHVNKNISPKNDFEIVLIELLLADQKSLEKNIIKNKKNIFSKDPKIKQEIELKNKCLEIIKSNKIIYTHDWSEEEKQIIKSFNLITSKPMIIIGNISEEDLNKEPNKYMLELKKLAFSRSINHHFISAKFEQELSSLDKEEKELFMSEYNIEKSGLESIIYDSYLTLDLLTFFTAGPSEVRAWTFIKGSLAPKCAGIIHTDFEKGFIKAEIYNFEDFQKYPSEKLLKEQGLIRLEGKKYIMQDGDVCYFKFNN